MKRILLVLVLFIIACGGDKTKENDTIVENTEEVIEEIDTTLYDNMSDEEKNDVLLRALVFRDFEQAKNLIKSGAGNNVSSSVLDYALGYDVDIVKHLVKNGADISKMTIIDWARSGWLEKVKESLSNGSDINFHNDNGMTPLTMASAWGHLDIVKYLVKNGADTSKMTIVEWASSGWLEKVKESLVNGTDIEATTEFGKTALMGASANGHIEVVKYLVENGANVTARGEYDGAQEALEFAFDNGHTEVAKYLAENGASAQQLLNMEFIKNAISGSLLKVKESIANGADINTYSSVDLNTALNYASSSGDLELAKYLVEQGIDINSEYGYGNTPLMDASESGHIEVVKYLVESGADLNKECGVSRGETALIFASRNGHIDVVEYLADKVDVNFQDLDGNTALMYAYEYGHAEIVEYLESKNATE